MSTVPSRVADPPVPPVAITTGATRVQAGAGYRPEIDGLRAIAVLAVVFFHSGIPLFAGGFVGVDTFFVISGYLITGILAREIAKGTFTIGGFYERRARRILPALVALLLGTVIAGLVLLVPHELTQLGKSAIAAALFVSNNFFFLQRGYFTADAAATPLLHTWSLGVEEQFYLLYPVYLLILHRLRINLLLGIVVGAVLSFLLSAAMLADAPTATFYLLPQRLWELLLGGIVALAPVCAVKGRSWISAAGLAGILAAAIFFDASTPFPGPAALLPCLGTAALIWASTGTPVARGLSVEPLRFVGLISYSLYLWHWPILVFGRMLTGGDLSPTARIICIALTFVVATASWRFIEQPFRGRSKRSRTSVLSAAGLSIVVVSAAGAMVMSGLPQRFSARDLRFMASAGNVSYSGPGCFLFRSSKPTPAAECLGPPTAKGKIVAWGDSHALQFAHALEHATPLDFRLLGRAACPPLLGVVPERRGSPDLACLAFNDDAISALAADRSVKVVILGARWIRFQFAVEDDDARTLMVAKNGRAQDVKTDMWAALALTVGRLQQAGKTVILFGQVPEFEAALPNCMARLERVGLSQDLCRFNRQTLPNSKFNQQFRQHAAGIPGLVLVDVPRALCRSGPCPRIVNDEPASFDRNHLTPAATMLVMQDPAVQVQLAKAVASASGR